MDGILLLYKEKGPTSFKAIEQVKKQIKINKIGHTGTLDPMAEGLLVVLLGNATKIADYVDDTKEYEMQIQFGASTDTDDAMGKEINTLPVPADLADKINAKIPDFTGKIMQIPPAYSAIKKDGKKLYELARAGKEVKPEPRAVEIFSIEVLEVLETTARLKVACSSGTYMRSLARDLAEAINTCGHLSYLKRTRIGKFSSDNALTLSAIEDLQKHIISINDTLYNVKEAPISAPEQLMLKNGIALKNRFGFKPGEVIKTVFDGKVLAMCTVEGSVLKINRGIEI
ncbi:MAG: tRNA pseudouridine(55) synthase TruB [Candidatus Goldbacteria bacterium]|nr:tRNA pseudouridine(55) synthase TruB [Candidatus Goldiibacteriota bacterium]